MIMLTDYRTQKETDFRQSPLCIVAECCKHSAMTEQVQKQPTEKSQPRPQRQTRERQLNAGLFAASPDGELHAHLRKLGLVCSALGLPFRLTFRLACRSPLSQARTCM